MSIELSKISYNAYDEPKVTITIRGYHDLYRMAHHLCFGQCDMGAIGAKMKRRMKRHVGKARWAWTLDYMHGEGGFR